MPLRIGRFHFYLRRPESPPDNFFGGNFPARHRQPAQMSLHFRKVAPCVHQRSEGHVTADSGEAIKIGNFHVAELMMRGSGCREERALYSDDTSLAVQHRQGRPNITRNGRNIFRKDGDLIEGRRVLQAGISVLQPWRTNRTTLSNEIFARVDQPAPYPAHRFAGQVFRADSALRAPTTTPDRAARQ